MAAAWGISTCIINPCQSQLGKCQSHRWCCWASEGVSPGWRNSSPSHSHQFLLHLDHLINTKEEVIQNIVEKNACCNIQIPFDHIYFICSADTLPINFTLWKAGKIASYRQLHQRIKLEMLPLQTTETYFQASHGISTAHHQETRSQTAQVLNGMLTEGGSPQAVHAEPFLLLQFPLHRQTSLRALFWLLKVWRKQRELGNEGSNQHLTSLWLIRPTRRSETAKRSENSSAFVGYCCVNKY